MLRSFRETYNSSLILKDSNCSKFMFGLGPARDKFELVVTSKTTHVNLNEFVKLSLHVVSACVTIPNTTSKWPINSWKITVERVGVKITHGACLDVSQISSEKRPFPIIQKPPVIHKIFVSFCLSKETCILCLSCHFFSPHFQALYLTLQATRPPTSRGIQINSFDRMISIQLMRGS